MVHGMKKNGHVVDPDLATAGVLGGDPGDAQQSETHEPGAQQLDDAHSHVPDARLGPFIVGVAIASLGTTAWFWISVAYCAVCAVICWMRYARPGAPFPG